MSDSENYRDQWREFDYLPGNGASPGNAYNYSLTLSSKEAYHDGYIRIRYCRCLAQTMAGTKAVEADISSRHLSFVETGRNHPSREMVLLLAEVLDVPPRARNDLLAAAGYAPIYRESSLDAPEMAPFRRALDFIMQQQEPFPAIALDRYWNILLANRGAGHFLGIFLDEADTVSLALPNAMRLICHPQALRPYILNWEVTAAALIQWLHHDLLRSADPGIQALLDELLAYPDMPRNWRSLDLDAPSMSFLVIDM